ncbi:MAG: cation:proton antiporter [Bacteroidia bacterium]
MSNYLIIVYLSIAIVLSYAYGEIAKRTNIPSVLMLIVTGILIGQFTDFSFNFFSALEILGVVGLIMIVLEGALDLELSKEKMPLIARATAVAILGIVGSMATIAALFHYLLHMQLSLAILYSAPLAVISSAIVIPSIGNLNAESDKEFLIYESCISDIIGIMVFYLCLSVAETGNLGGSLGEFGINLVLTLIVSVLVAIGLILLFKFLNAKVKLFFFISILILIYALGKMMHLSPLILILIFGLVLKNHKLVFRGRLSNLMTRMEFRKMERDFHIITRETAFILRTFFFLVFGITIDMASIIDVNVLLISLMSFILILIVRVILLGSFASKMNDVLIYIAPRGLITVLLFYSIPASVQETKFQPGVILWMVILTSLYMTYGLIKDGKKQALEAEHPE